MKIMIINTTGKEGSTGKIAFGLKNQIELDGSQCIVCYGRPGESDAGLVRISTTPEVYVNALLTRITGRVNSFAYFSTKNLHSIIKEYKPDIIQLFNLHGYYINEKELFRITSRMQIPIVYTMLDEYPYMGKCCYSFDCDKFKRRCVKCPYLSQYPKSLFFDTSGLLQSNKKKAYAINKIIYTAPKWVTERARESFLLYDGEIVEIDEPVDLHGYFYPREYNEVCQKYGIPQSGKIILNVAKFSDYRKGVSWFLKLAQAYKKEDTYFVNVGYDSESKNLPNNFIPIGYVKNQEELAQLYSRADLLMCTSLADTMPNTCLEALACGTPICAFNTAGTPYIADNTVAEFLDLADIKAMANVVDKVDVKNNQIIRKCREYAEKRYSYEIFYKKIKPLYKKLMRED